MYVIKLVTIVIKMMSLIKSGHWKILQLFYTDKTAKLHLREIARKAKLHEPSTTVFLKSLEKDTVLKSEKDGNQKKYTLKLNYKTYSMFQLFDLERFNSLPSIRKNAIKYFLEHLADKPLIMFVFGSTAKGVFKEDSDIDLLLISKIKTDEAEKHSENLTGIKISVFQMTLVDFSKEIKLKEDPVIQSAITTGYPVLNNLYYYEVLYDGH
jgi:predicted nucleotidyltransferase